MRRGGSSPPPTHDPAALGGIDRRELESGKGRIGHDLVRNAFMKWHQGPRSIYGGRMGPVTDVTERR